MIARLANMARIPMTRKFEMIVKVVSAPPDQNRWDGLMELINKLSSAGLPCRV